MLRCVRPYTRDRAGQEMKSDDELKSEGDKIKSGQDIETWQYHSLLSDMYRAFTEVKEVDGVKTKGTDRPVFEKMYRGWMKALRWYFE
jgi:hypothetical protein